MARSDPARLQALAAALERACAEQGVTVGRSAIPYGIKCTLAREGASGVVSLYATGRVVPNPAAARHFAGVLAALDADAGPAGPAARPRHAPVRHPYAGSDESGKGDYFGPVVVAAVIVADPAEDERLRALGVRDSKLFTGTRGVRELARRIGEVCAGRIGEVEISPERYNARVDELRAEGKTSNAQLALAHAAAVEAAARGSAGPPRLWVADRFGAEPELRLALAARGLDVELRQETGGERYTAVAAASNVARARCLDWFDQAEAEVGERLPRGAFDPGIVHVARRLHAAGGLARLGRYAKLHFRTTLKVAGGAAVPGAGAR